MKKNAAENDEIIERIFGWIEYEGIGKKDFMSVLWAVSMEYQDEPRKIEHLLEKLAQLSHPFMGIK